MNKKPDNRILWKYAGLATQFLVGIGLAVLAGRYIDNYAGFSHPFVIWALPLLFIIAVIAGIIRDTSKKN